MYIVFAIEVPLIIANVMLYLTNKSEKYRFIIRLINIVMILGIFAIPVLNYFSGN